MVGRQVTTWNQQQLGEIKRELMQVLRRNRGKNATADAYSSLNQAEAGASHRLQVRPVTPGSVVPRVAPVLPEI